LYPTRSAPSRSAKSIISFMSSACKMIRRLFTYEDLGSDVRRGIFLTFCNLSTNLQYILICFYDFVCVFS
jgi:hypothetical protein